MTKMGRGRGKVSSLDNSLARWDMAADAPLRLGTFVAEARYADLPPEIVEKAKRHTLDTLGAGLAGATSEEAKRTLVSLVRR
jgi:2-methylcitrate dehydratase PrpD